MTKEALKLALYGLEIGLPLIEDFGSTEQLNAQHKAISAIYEALAQPEQEPVALEEKFSLLLWDYQELERAFEKVTGGKWVRKSNTPQRTWVGLTGDEISECMEMSIQKTCRAIETKLKEKNT